MASEIAKSLLDAAADLRDAVDGMQFQTAAYTYNALNKLGSKVKWGADVAQVLDQAVVLDPQTVQLNFKTPAPPKGETFYYPVLSIKPQGINKDDVITAQIDSLLVPFAGAFSIPTCTTV